MVQQDAAGSSLTLRNSTEGLNRYADVAVDFGAPGSGFVSNGLPTDHDRWGRVTQDLDRLYDWDAEGRLRTVRNADNGTTIATYAYDSQSRRILRRLHDYNTGLTVIGTTRYVWDGDPVTGPILFWTAGGT
jgi:YD repeat-containing protein